MIWVYDTNGSPQVLTPREVIGFHVAPGRINRKFMECVIENTFRAASRPADSSGHAFMRDLLRSWIAADCNLKRWENDNPRMAYKLNRRYADWRPRLLSGRAGRPQPMLMGLSGFEADAAQKANSDEPLAYDLFAVFLFAAAPRVQIGMCDRCEHFYWNRWGHKNKRFCGRKCSQLQTAIEGQEKRLGAERRAKNRRIRQSIQNFITRKPQTSEWRRWAAKDAGVSLNYLTRAVHRGGLGKPDGVKLTRMQAGYLRKCEKGEEP